MWSFFIILDWTRVGFSLGCPVQGQTSFFFVVVVGNFLKGYERKISGQIRLVEWNHQKHFSAEKIDILAVSNVHMQITDPRHCACSLQCY